MQVTLQPITVHKRAPLAISRGAVPQATTLLWLQLEAEGITGWGEACPFSIGTQSWSSAALKDELEQLVPILSTYHPLQRQRIDQIIAEMNLSSAVRAAVNTALFDWLGKRVQQPLWQLWGLDCKQIPPTSVTIGLGTPEQSRARLQDWLRQGPFQAIKVKLGSPDGIEADQAMMQAIVDHLPDGVSLSVDANGGWSLQQALKMIRWLEPLGVRYVEQPLAVSANAQLAELHSSASLPIFIDESCFNAQDILTLAPAIDGINIKLMKCGGLQTALDMITIARACGLQVMFGCYANSSLGNTALAHLAPCAQHLDLDSHLNLRDDPFLGAEIAEGILTPKSLPGLGVSYHAPHPG